MQSPVSIRIMLALIGLRASPAPVLRAAWVEAVRVLGVEGDGVKIQVELHEVNARTAKLTAESKWYPFVVGAGLLAAGGALVKIFF